MEAMVINNNSGGWDVYVWGYLFLIHLDVNNITIVQQTLCINVSFQCATFNLLMHSVPKWSDTF